MKQDKTGIPSFEEFKRKMQDIEKKAKAKVEERMKTKGVKTEFSSVEELEEYYEAIPADSLHEKWVEMNGGIDPMNPPYPSEHTKGIKCDFDDATMSATVFGDRLYDDAVFIGLPQSVIKDGKKYLITKIGKEAFVDFPALKTLCTSNTIKEIESGAFKGCESLRTLILSDCLERYANDSFNGCLNLEQVVFQQFGYPRKKCRLARSWKMLEKKIIKDAHKIVNEATGQRSFPGFKSDEDFSDYMENLEKEVHQICVEMKCREKNPQFSSVKEIEEYYDCKDVDTVFKELMDNIYKS